MSSTNKTTNYELSQFIGTDKPTYLGDYNSDMLKIDTQMKANATAASTADGKAVTADGKAVTALENAATADGKAVTAGETATSALNKATANETAISKLQDSVLYSSTEHEVGKWIDNKTIYAKTVEINILTDNVSINEAIDIANLDKVVKLEYMSERTSNINVDYDYNDYYIANTDFQRVFVHYESGAYTLRIRAYYPAGYTTKKLIVTLFYTKNSI